MADRVTQPLLKDALPAPPCYRIKSWKATFERSDLKKTHTWSWVAVPNKHDGKGFRRLAHHPLGIRVFCAWNLIYQVASKMPVRGTLADEDGPLTAEDLAAKTGFPSEIFHEAFEVLTNPELRIGWLEKIDTPIRMHPDTSGLENNREQNNTGENNTSRSPSENSPAAEAGQCDAGSERTPCGADEPTADAIYAAYPRHIEPKPAKKAIQDAISNLRQRGTPRAAAWLLSRVQLYAAARKELEKHDPEASRFIPYPQRWFAKGRYDDDPAEWSRRSSPTRNGHTSKSPHPTVPSGQSVRKVQLRGKV